MIAIVAKVNGGTKKMTRAICSVLIMTLQLGYIIHRAQHAGDNELVEGYTLVVQTVVESLSNVL